MLVLLSELSILTANLKRQSLPSSPLMLNMSGSDSSLHRNDQDFTESIFIRIRTCRAGLTSSHPTHQHLRHIPVQSRLSANEQVLSRQALKSFMHNRFSRSCMTSSSSFVEPQGIRSKNARLTIRLHAHSHLGPFRFLHRSHHRAVAPHPFLVQTNVDDLS